MAEVTGDDVAVVSGVPGAVVPWPIAVDISETSELGITWRAHMFMYFYVFLASWGLESHSILGLQAYTRALMEFDGFYWACKVSENGIVRR